MTFLRIASFVLLALFGRLRVLLPLFAQRALLKLEYPCANRIFWLGGGIDDAVDAFLRQHEAVYKLFLVKRVISAATDSRVQSDALLHLCSFERMEEAYCMELRDFAKSSASPLARGEIANLLKFWRSPVELA